MTTMSLINQLSITKGGLLVCWVYDLLRLISDLPYGVESERRGFFILEDILLRLSNNKWKILLR